MIAGHVLGPSTAFRTEFVPRTRYLIRIFALRPTTSSPRPSSTEKVWAPFTFEKSLRC